MPTLETLDDAALAAEEARLKERLEALDRVDARPEELDEIDEAAARIDAIADERWARRCAGADAAAARAFREAARDRAYGAWLTGAGR